MTTQKSDFFVLKLVETRERVPILSPMPSTIKKPGRGYEACMCGMEKGFSGSVGGRGWGRHLASEMTEHGIADEDILAVCLYKQPPISMRRDGRGGVIDPFLCTGGEWDRI